MAAASATTDMKKVSVSSHIPDDLTFSILSKLPLKSLTRFTCVQKSWSLLFQNSIFMNMFRTNFLLSKHDEDDENTCVLLKQMEGRRPYHTSLYTLSGEKFENSVRLDLPTPLHENDSFIHILCSVGINGVICLYNNDCRNANKIIVLWNPATEEFKVVPHSHQPYENIEFNPRPFTFGYDPVTNDYKVIRVANYHIYFEDNWIYLPRKESLLWRKDDPLWKQYMFYDSHFWEGYELQVYEPFLEIYSLRSNSWRKLNMDLSVFWDGHSMMNLNELCHWQVNDQMASFDFTNEIFFETTLPSFDLKDGMSTKKDLAVLHGSVAFIHNVVETGYLHIWILGELGVNESWTKLFVLGPVPCIGRPIGVRIKSVMFYLKEDEELAWIDLSTQRIEEIGIKAESPAWLQIVTYKENLLSFVGMNN